MFSESKCKYQQIILICDKRPKESNCAQVCTGEQLTKGGTSKADIKNTENTTENTIAINNAI